jgi:hypothetical protein
VIYTYYNGREATFWAPEHTDNRPEVAAALRDIAPPKTTKARMMSKDATHIEVAARVRYWEDGEVNGVSEDDDNPLMPGASGEMWNARIALATGHIDGWPAGTTASIHYKVCDEGEYWLLNAAGERISKWRGYYVPNGFLCHGSEGFGDYIILSIGDDGRVIGWTVPEIEPEDWVAFVDGEPA